MLWALHAQPRAARRRRARGARRWAEVTVTADARPNDHLSVRLEHRREMADRALYFQGSAAMRADGPFAPTRAHNNPSRAALRVWF